MLLSLHIENLAVIKSVDISFENGFTVLTGETGAGKSILIDSINLLLGARPEKDMIRSGEQKATLSAIFENLSENCVKKLEDNEISPDEDGRLHIVRTVSTDGKSRTKINGMTVPVSVQREIAPYLISIHGQHDNHELLSSASHILFLDGYAGIEKEVADFSSLYSEMNETKREIIAMKKDERDKAGTVDVLKFRIGEIDALKLRAGEEDELERRLKLLQNSEKIVKSARTAYRALYRNEKGMSAYELVNRSIPALESLVDYVPESGSCIKKLSEISAELEEIGLTLRESAGGDGEEPSEEIDTVMSRLESIRKICLKYGGTTSDVLKYREECAEKLRNIENGEENLKILSRKMNELAKRATEAAKELSAKRKSAAKELTEKITDELVFLEMPKVRFSVDIKPSTSEDGSVVFNRRGFDSVEFLISANPGEPLKPISKIASGGELSRIMLALKTANSKSSDGITMIFDEIDVGISGKTSQKIGIRLRELASTTQVLCVTHSAQIASVAHNHLFISKSESDGRTMTEVREIRGEDRVREIARIMGGLQITEKLIETSREMLGEYNNA